MTWLVLLSLLQIASCQIISGAEQTPESYRCQYTPPKQSQVVTGIKIDPLPPGYRSRRQSENNLRIHYEYTSNFNSYSGANQLKAEIMEPARAELERLLKPKSPTNGILRVDRQCVFGAYRRNVLKQQGCSSGCLSSSTCNSVAIPERFLKQCKVITSFGELKLSETEGVGIANKDIVLLVDYSSCPTNSLATASSCFSEATLDRPILGVIRICSTAITAGSDVARNIKVVQHEIIHALGFAVDKFAYYRFSNGVPMVSRNDFGFPSLSIHSESGAYQWNTTATAKEVTRTHESIFRFWTKSVVALILPNVVKAAKAHFGCDAIDSVDLEDPGISGSSYSHFDELFLDDELMTPVINGFSSPLSIMTLALLYDTGWYTIECTAAQKLEYGANSGCNIPLKGCYRYMTEKRNGNQSIAPFCDKISEPGNILACSGDKRAIQYCPMSSNPTSNNNYRYFSDNTRGGNSQVAEYCPMINKLYNCSDEKNDLSKGSTFADFNVFGSNSRCFQSNWSSNLTTYTGAICLQVSCPISSSNQYNIIVQGNTYSCQDNTDIIITASGSNASLTCPPAMSVCGAQLFSYSGSCPEPNNGIAKSANFQAQTKYLLVSLLLIFVILFYETLESKN